ncbi:MAG TPA: pyridoxamine 5'-phosphate oxidase family protein [Anaeromyxobacteraceae bacterium]|nr:pyridoxamine 5'-phosphate oxidase family protein [Anaeromyxobacteraceae bacterium]
MRRADRAISDPAAIRAILEEALVCRLAMASGDQPYLVPLNFALDGQELVLHMASEGTKVEMLRRNPRVCFEAEAGVEVIPADRPCDVGMRFRSVVGFGEARFVDGEEEKARALQLLAAKYAPGAKAGISPLRVRQTLVVRVAIRELHGKQSGY